MARGKSAERPAINYVQDCVLFSLFRSALSSIFCVRQAKFSVSGGSGSGGCVY